MRIDFIYTDKNGEHNDYAEVSGLENAEVELVELIAKFNHVEKARYGKDAVLRKFKYWMVPKKMRGWVLK